MMMMVMATPTTNKKKPARLSDYILSKVYHAVMKDKKSSVVVCHNLKRGRKRACQTTNATRMDAALH